MKFALKIIVPFVFIGLALLGVKILIINKKPLPARAPEVVVAQADVISVEQKDHRPPVISYGTVQSYFETTLVPQVSGQIKEVSQEFRAGNQVKKGTVLARIDDADYVAALALKNSNLAIAKRALAEEQIKAEQAAKDWLASGRDLASATDFVLRKPQLAAAQATIGSTQAAVRKAEVDIERTIVRAPYDAVILSRTASAGNFASQQQSLGKLVATERVEIRLPLTANQAARVKLPGLSNKDSADELEVILSSATKAGAQWQGKLVRTELAVDARNQVTYVIAEVESPYAAVPQPLVVGTFVNVTIPAKTIPRAYQVPESALVNDSLVWVLDGENQLCRVAAERIHSYDGNVYLQLSAADLAAGKIKPPLRIVTRPLANFKSGKKVKPVFDSQER